MASHGIKDKVAIVGMGCTAFGERWDMGLDDLILDATTECLESAGAKKDEVDAWWVGTAQSGMSGLTLARPLQLENKPVTRVENYCASGSESLRAAAYAVASGAYDVAVAVGAEKVKDSGYQGLNANNPPGDGTARTLTAAAMFSMVAPAYAAKYGVDKGQIVDVLADLVEEPLQRCPQPSRRSSVARCRPSRSGSHRESPEISAFSIAPASQTVPPRRWSCAQRTRTATPTNPYT